VQSHLERTFRIGRAGGYGGVGRSLRCAAGLRAPCNLAQLRAIARIEKQAPNAPDTAKPQNATDASAHCHFGSFACTLVDSGFNAVPTDLGTLTAAGAELLESNDAQSSVWIIERPTRSNWTTLADPRPAGARSGVRGGLFGAELRVQG